MHLCPIYLRIALNSALHFMRFMAWYKYITAFFYYIIPITRETLETKIVRFSD